MPCVLYTACLCCSDQDNKSPAAHVCVRVSPLQVRDRAMLHLTQLQGGAGGTGAISTDLDINLSAFESSLRGYLDVDDTQQPFDVVRLLGMFKGA